MVGTGDGGRRAEQEGEVGWGGGKCGMTEVREAEPGTWEKVRILRSAALKACEAPAPRPVSRPTSPPTRHKPTFCKGFRHFFPLHVSMCGSTPCVCECAEVNGSAKDGW